VAASRAPSWVITKRAPQPSPSTLNLIMSANSSLMRSGLKPAMTGRGCGLRSARSQVLSRSRCLIDLTTEGLALSNFIFGY
jgi:hypothetical protein